MYLSNIIYLIKNMNANQMILSEFLNNKVKIITQIQKTK